MKQIVIVMLWALLAPLIGEVHAAPAVLWDVEDGVQLQADGSGASLGGGAKSPIVLRFSADGEEARLAVPQVARVGTGLKLTYQVLKAGNNLTIEREVTLLPQAVGGSALVESFRVKAAAPLATDLEIVRPWQMHTTAATTDAAQITWPLHSGWARPQTLTAQPLRGEFRLGNVLSGAETPQLALPVLQVSKGALTGALYADPMFGALFEATGEAGGAAGNLRYRYTAEVPWQEETRSFALWLRPAAKADQGQEFPATMDGFFRLMQPDVPAGPRWLHDIAMVGYDYLSDGGAGWENDVKALAAMLTPAERKRVALCFHGWYDGIGSYCYDETTGKLKESWVAFPATRKVPFTQDEVRRRLRVARDAGFRVLIYYADGVLSDSGQPFYHADRAFKKADGGYITGWQGPDTLGPTHAQNPAHPAVRRFYEGYLEALIKAYGAEVDGFVWDETFYIRTGMKSRAPQPDYADRAMLTLTRTLRDKVKKSLGPEKVFLTSDAHGVFGWRDVPPSALWADGTYQDTHYRPSVWSYGFFPNWRNTIWSCNWEPLTHFDYMEWGVKTYSTPVALSNGWADDKGPSEWNAAERDRFLALFRGKIQRGAAVRFLTQNPATLLAVGPREDGAAPPEVGIDNEALLGEAIPEPAPGEQNWALASQGATATASSQTKDAYGVWTAAGVIDGKRDDSGWGQGHGWTSDAGAALPQWVQVDFPQARSVNRFIVITYHKAGSPETAAKWGVTNYQIQVWDAATNDWKTVVRETASRTVKTRVHRLAAPLRTGKFRVMALNVAPQDGRARLLQVEAWGNSTP